MSCFSSVDLVFNLANLQFVGMMVKDWANDGNSCILNQSLSCSFLNNFNCLTPFFSLFPFKFWFAFFCILFHLSLYLSNALSSFFTSSLSILQLWPPGLDLRRSRSDFTEAGPIPEEKAPFLFWLPLWLCVGEPQRQIGRGTFLSSSDRKIIE